MANKLIQWNCRGLKANFNELLLLLTGLCPIICLQETFLKPGDNLDIRGYTLYNHIHQAGDRAFGGSSIILNDSTPQSQIQLNTNLRDVEIPVVDQYKFLGIFDRKLSFIPHINYLKAKCQKALQLLRVVAHTDWGADKLTLLILYRSLVRSKLDYGCFIYGSARKSHLRYLDSIHHLGLRLALGALRTSPVESLYV